MKTVLNTEATLHLNRNRPLHSFVNWTAPATEKPRSSWGWIRRLCSFGDEMTNQLLQHSSGDFLKMWKPARRPSCCDFEFEISLIHPVRLCSDVSSDVFSAGRNMTRPIGVLRDGNGQVLLWMKARSSCKLINNGDYQKTSAWMLW